MPGSLGCPCWLSLQSIASVYPFKCRILDFIRQTVSGCCAPRFAETPFKADVIRRRVTMTTETTASGAVGLGRGGHMSRQRKRDAVLRLLRGEDLEMLSRALGV